MSLTPEQSWVLVLVIGMLIAPVVIVIRQIRVEKAKRPQPRCKVGEVALTEQGVNYLVNRMRDRILQLTDDNERLRVELHHMALRNLHLVATLGEKEQTWEAYCREKA